MPEPLARHARVAIIGGGILGCSTLYHLTLRGWTDTVLLERLELTAGSTWHAAGNLPHFSTNLDVMRLQQYSIGLYRQLGGSHVGHHPTGALRLAHTPERLDEFRRVADMANSLGLDFAVLTPDELHAMNPLLRTDGLVGGLHDPADGHIDPTSVTMEMARRARENGARVIQHCPVQQIEREANGWRLTTPRGEVTADILVNAAGYRAQEVARMVGHTIPMMSMEHQYLVTDSIPELSKGWEMPMVRDPDTSYYLRQEGHGLILGPYEPQGRPWAVDGVPPAFGQELLKPDLDRLEDIITAAIDQVPIIGEVGIKTVVNGPITYTPDGHPLIGPTTGIEDYFLCTGSNFGIVQGGGAGKYTSDWIVDGHPEHDCLDLDPRRFGDFAAHDYVVEKCQEVYAHEYALGLPHEYESRRGARPGRTSGVHDQLINQGAVFELRSGYECAAWFDPEQQTEGKITSFRDGPWTTVIGQEHDTLHSAAGIADISATSKFRVSGSQATSYLDDLLASVMPDTLGQGRPGFAVDRAGGLSCVFTVARLGAEEYLLTTSIESRQRAQDVLGTGADCARVEDVTDDVHALLLAGPAAGRISALAGLTIDDPVALNPADLVSRPTAVCVRTSEPGGTSLRVYAAPAELSHLYQRILIHGGPHGLKPVGLHALDVLRICSGDAGNPEFTPTRTPFAAGLHAHMKPLDSGFPGATALAERAAGREEQLTQVEVTSHGARPFGQEPIYNGSALVGRVTSGAPGHALESSYALAYLDPEHAGPGTDLEIQVLGKRCTARVV